MPEIVHRFKSLTTHLYSQGVKQQDWVSYPGKLWQRNYFEHVVRNEDELARICEYIENNLHTWDEDEENPNSDFYKIRN